jgi:hypothetical protein
MVRYSGHVQIIVKQLVIRFRFFRLDFFIYFTELLHLGKTRPICSYDGVNEITNLRKRKHLS